MHDFGMSAFTYLQQQQVIESFRSFANTLLNSLDDTGYFCFESIHCPSCAVAHHSDGRTSCSRSVVIPAIGKPGCSQVIPLEPEFIVHQDGHKKQDCEQMGARFCRGCGYCLPCPEDIPIPTVTFLKVFSMQMPRDQVITEEHDRAVELAKGCSECRQCVERCPYDLEIPDMLKENIRFYESFSAR